jgi:hypothetical protein
MSIANEATRQTQVSEQMDCLSNTLDRSRELQGQLTDRLGGVLRPVEPQPECDSDKAPELVGLANRIRQQVTLLKAHNSVYEEVLNRLEL